MALTDHLSERLRRHPKRVVFAEGTDPRIIQAARQFATRQLGVPILLGDRLTIKDHATRLSLRLNGIRIIDPAQSEELERFTRQLAELWPEHGLTQEQLREKVAHPAWFGALMLRRAQVDALVTGAAASDTNALEPLLRIIPRQEGAETVSSMLILDMDYPKLGNDGVLFLADCGVVKQPTAGQLADIAVTTASLCFHLTNARPRVAMLAYSTKGGHLEDPSIERILQATEKARQKARGRIDMDIDGELQVDTALVRQAAEFKQIGGPVAGQANVLIFPDLHSGNIASKMLQIVADSRSHGQIITGLSRPCADISRGASAHDVFGAAVLVASQAIEHRLLYGADPGPLEVTGDGWLPRDD